MFITLFRFVMFEAEDWKVAIFLCFAVEFLAFILILYIYIYILLWRSVQICEFFPYAVVYSSMCEIVGFYHVGSQICEVVSCCSMLVYSLMCEIVVFYHVGVQFFFMLFILVCLHIAQVKIVWMYVILTSLWLWSL